jgi:hypothetical protein
MNKHIVPAFDIANQDKGLKSFPWGRSAPSPERGRIELVLSPVMKASGMLAACTQDSCGGLRRICVSGTEINSA